MPTLAPPLRLYRQPRRARLGGATAAALSSRVAGRARKTVTIVLPDGGVFKDGFYENSKDFDRFRKDYDMVGLYRLDIADEIPVMARDWEHVENGGMYQVVMRPIATIKDHEGRFKARDKGLEHEGNAACLHLLQQRYSQLSILQEGVKLKDGEIVVGELDGLLFDDDTNTAIICEVKSYVRLEHIVEVEDKVELYDKFGVANGLPGATKIISVLVGKSFPQHLRERAFKRGIIVLVPNGAGHWRIFGNELAEGKSNKTGHVATSMSAL
eukprot:TRINITY_DN820_c0_g2_i1.p1 TRINITY_DN820_c0_g2~~TRINITY_DN820_c0_g2_i1.p1  ORF type:complete len:269 (+),score=34.78 TRINITY_DN820_c0_g2_i1:118-924(+)